MNLSLYRFGSFIVFITLFFSCTKIITTDIGSGLIPPVDGVITKDTLLTILSKNVGYDTISVGISDDHVLGYTNDPIFGTTAASLNFQVAPPSHPFSWGFDKKDIVLDSVVLCLDYKGSWGDSLQPLKLRVYSMDPEVIFRSDSAYRNTTTFLKGQELTEFNVAHTVDITKLNDVDTTDETYKEVTTNQIRIRLNNAFGQKLIDLDSASVYQSDSTFYNYLRGLIVEPEQTGQALLHVNLADTTTHLSLYYHKDTVTATRRFSPDVLTSASSNSILRDYSNTAIPGYIASHADNDAEIFMEASPGIRASLKTPALDSLKNMIVHRAEILMYQVPDDDTDIFTPPNLFLAAHSDSADRSFAIPNDITFYGNSISNLAQFGVAPKVLADSRSIYYSFDISRYVQGIVTNGEPVYDLVLIAPYNQYVYPTINSLYAIPISSPTLNTVATGRVRLGGGSANQYTMKLHIVYSLIK
ncbi:MAG TPA: DUF4270 family protein [Parafilimonas sp.]|nr:DUF4270 family protein [Parafilimonas sp.]